MTKTRLESVSSELARAELGDVRRSRRLERIVERMQARPNASFPAIMTDPSELEAVYRFLSSDHVQPDAILEPHLQASVARASIETTVLAVHDTTNFEFMGEREGLGRVHVNDHGFWGHFALAVTPDRRALGLVGWRYGTRHGPSRWKGTRRIKGVGEDEDSEHLRWPELAAEVGERFGPQKVVHVMDREADWFELFESLVDGGQCFVIRLAHDRLVEDGHISDLWEKSEAVAFREVKLSGRAEGDTARARKRHPPRKPRIAQLQIKGASAELRHHKSKRRLPLNFIRVLEIDPPEGCAPVVWNLITTEDVESEEQLLAVVDAYRARWVIEEFFKAIKTGCAFEKRQLCSYGALLNALAVLAPIAWSLLRLRDTGRRFPNAPGDGLLSARLLNILQQLARQPLPEQPTARQVMYAVAALGGHLKRNGDPGWQTLGRGYERLIEAAEVLRRCDQS